MLNSKTPFLTVNLREYNNKNQRANLTGLATNHQVTIILTTSKNGQYPGHNDKLTTG